MRRRIVRLGGNRQRPGDCGGDVLFQFQRIKGGEIKTDAVTVGLEQPFFRLGQVPRDAAPQHIKGRQRKLAVQVAMIRRLLEQSGGPIVAGGDSAPAQQGQIPQGGFAPAVVAIDGFLPLLARQRVIAHVEGRQPQAIGRFVRRIRAGRHETQQKT